MIGKELYQFLSGLDTEQRNPETWHIDLAEPEEIVDLINAQDKFVAEAVHRKKCEIALAIEHCALRLATGGRLIYVGAGTSGRIGVVDASECPPTFGTHPDQVIALMAGGPQAMFRAQEGSEDSLQAGKQALIDIKITSNDMVCGLAASGRTPFVLGALEYAKELGCKTVFICCVPRTQLKMETLPDIVIDVTVGPEAIMGSTRMKSATAQKMVVNMITTGAMIRQGKVFENVMVDLQLTNQKLVERAKRIIMMLTGCEYDRAAQLLEWSKGHVKTALVMQLKDVTFDEAQQRLKSSKGFVRKALE